MSKKIYPCIVFFSLIFLGYTGCSSKETGEKIYIAALQQYNQQNFSKTVELCNLILSQNKKMHQAEFLKGKALYFLGDGAGATKCFEKLKQKIPEHVESRIWYIRSLLAEKNYEKAASVLRQEIVLNETDWRLYYLDALLAEKTENYEKQLSALKYAEKAFADGSKIFLDLSKLWFYLGIDSKASEYLQKAQSFSEVNVEQQIILDTYKNLLENKES